MIYQSANPTKNTSGKRCWTYALKGNGKFGNVTRTGWAEAQLTKDQTEVIEYLLKKNDVRSVYRRENKFYEMLENGIERQILTNSKAVRI